MINENHTVLPPSLGRAHQQRAATTGSDMSDVTYAQAYRRLATSQKTGKGAPAYSRFVNRRLGRHLAAVAAALGATPNQVTVLSGVMTFTGIGLIALARPTVLVAAVVCVLLVLGYALDSADGQLARLTGGGSPAGEWLDHVLDAVKIATLHLAILLSLYRFAGLNDERGYLIPLAFSAVGSSFFFATWITDALRRARGTQATPSTAAPLWRSLAGLPTDFGLLCLVMLLLPWTSVFLWAYGLLLIGTAAYFGAALPVWWRELSAPAASGPEQRVGEATSGQTRGTPPRE